MSVAGISASSVSPINPAPSGGGSAPGAGRAAFGDLLKDLLAHEASANQAADKAITDLATGKAESIHEVGLAVAQADLQFRLVLELRNRLTDAYQEVMRMQI
jgi:flagellar hook-basal body complex protein FliE